MVDFSEEPLIWLGRRHILREPLKDRMIRFHWESIGLDGGVAGAEVVVDVVEAIIDGRMGVRLQLSTLIGRSGVTWQWKVGALVNDEVF